MRAEDPREGPRGSAEATRRTTAPTKRVTTQCRPSEPYQIFLRQCQIPDRLSSLGHRTNQGVLPICPFPLRPPIRCRSSSSGSRSGWGHLVPSQPTKRPSAMPERRPASEDPPPRQLHRVGPLRPGADGARGVSGRRPPLADDRRPLLLVGRIAHPFGLKDRQSRTSASLCRQRHQHPRRRHPLHRARPHRHGPLTVTHEKGKPFP